MVKIPNKLEYNDVYLIFKNKGLILVSKEYKNSKTPLSCYDGNGYWYYLTLGNVKDYRTKKFNIVSNQNIYSIKNIQQFIYNNHHKTIVLSTNYIDIHTKLKLKCECGRVFYLSWSHMSNLNKCVCNKCGYHYISETQRTTVQDLEKEVNQYGYTLAKNQEQKSKSLLVEDKDGNQYHTNIYSFRNGFLPSQGSSLEIRTKQYLDSLNINYIEQKIFDGCRNKNPLRFDFYLPLYKIAIECDGDQHYIPIDYFGGKEGLLSLQKRDKIKETYCQHNNIKLIRIKQDQFKNNTYKQIIDKIIK